MSDDSELLALTDEQLAERLECLKRETKRHLAEHFQREAEKAEQAKTERAQDTPEARQAVVASDCTDPPIPR